MHWRKGRRQRRRGGQAHLDVAGCQLAAFVQLHNPVDVAVEANIEDARVVRRIVGYDAAAASWLQEKGACFLCCRLITSMVLARLLGAWSAHTLQLGSTGAFRHLKVVPHVRPPSPFGGPSLGNAGATRILLAITDDPPHWSARHENRAIVRMGMIMEVIEPKVSRHAPGSPLKCAPNLATALKHLADGAFVCAWRFGDVVCAPVPARLARKSN